MKYIFEFTILAVAIISCGPKENKQATSKAETTPVVTPQLTDQQKADGWKVLFDGQTMDGWRIFKGRKNNTWEVKDGTLHAIALNESVKGVGDERTDIMTAGEYGNFELTFDWKISKEGNSGLIYRATEEFEQPYYSGPEYQIIDEFQYPGLLKETQHSGANYDMNAPSREAARKVGQWNTAKIVANGNHIEHWLNGIKVVEYELGSADWKKRRGESKWKDQKGYGLSARGHIDLQDHGSEVWFRNIFIREL